MFSLFPEILYYFKSIQNPLLNNFFIFITLFGEEYFIIPVIALFYWCISKEKGIIIAVSYLSSMLINDFLKIAVHAQRPFEVLNDLSPIRVHTATGYSFPSGHTQGAASIFTLLSLTIRKKTFTILSAAVIFLVGISRLYLNVHWPLDVAAAWILGIGISVFLFNTLTRLNKEKHDSFLKMLILTASVSFIISLTAFIIKYSIYDALKISNIITISGVSIGTISGYILDFKTLNFKTAGKNRVITVLRYSAGIISALVLMQVLKYTFKQTGGNEELLRFTRYLISGFYISYIYPYLGVKLNLFHGGSK